MKDMKSSEPEEKIKSEPRMLRKEDFDFRC